MTLLSPVNEFGWRLTTDASRPANPFGEVFTPGNNTYSAWATLIAGASVPYAVRAIEIVVNNYYASAAARDLIVDIGVDPAGGTSYTALLTGLLATSAVYLSAACVGLRYHFPVFIPAGSSIGVRGSANSASGASCRAYAKLWGQPSRPELLPPFGGFQALGVTPASSSGTAITPGTTSDGAWTSLGTLARDAYWWQMGFGLNNSVQNNLTYFADLAVGDASNKKMLIENAVMTTSSNEIVGWELPAHCWGRGRAGETVYARMQCSGTPDSGLSVSAYAIG